MQVASIDIRRALAEASVSGLPGLLFGAGARRSAKAPSAPSMTQCSAATLALELSACSSSAGIDAKLP